MGAPGWPLLAFCTMSADSTRIVLIVFSSILMIFPFYSKHPVCLFSLQDFADRRYIHQVTQVTDGTIQRA